MGGIVSLWRELGNVEPFKIILHYCLGLVVLYDECENNVSLPMISYFYANLYYL